MIEVNLLVSQHRLQAAVLPRRRALTLIETLAVVVVVGLVASLIAANLVGADAMARITACVHRIQELDRLGRIAAQTSDIGVTILTIDSAELEIRLEARSTGEVLATEVMNEGLWPEFEGEQGQPLQSIAFDTRGRSVDYRVTVAAHPRQQMARHKGSNSTDVRQSRVHGLTGLFEPTERAQ